jgi:hypothetical protein
MHQCALYNPKYGNSLNHPGPIQLPNSLSHLGPLQLPNSLSHPCIYCNVDIKPTKYYFALLYKGCRGRDRIVVGFTTTCAISVYHH